MSPEGETRLIIEEHWRQEMERAHAVYLEASHRHAQMVLGQVAFVDVTRAGRAAA